MRKITETELKTILEKHKLWLQKKGGERAILQEVDLQCADLRDADLRFADLRRTCLQHSDLQAVDLRYANMQDVDLQYADLRCAELLRTDLRHADLKYAMLDHSCLPFWCGSLSAHFDDRQLAQIAYHLVRAGLHSKNASDAMKRELMKIVDIANTSHLVEICGKIGDVQL